MYRQFYVHLSCSLLYIQGEVVQFSWSIMFRRSVVGDQVSLVSLRPIPFLLIDTIIDEEIGLVTTLVTTS